MGHWIWGIIIVPAVSLDDRLCSVQATVSIKIEFSPTAKKL